jgi:hypothetical protein
LAVTDAVLLPLFCSSTLAPVARPVTVPPTVIGVEPVPPEMLSPPHAASIKLAEHNTPAAIHRIMWFTRQALHPKLDRSRRLRVIH